MGSDADEDAVHADASGTGTDADQGDTGAVTGADRRRAVVLGSSGARTAARKAPGTCAASRVQGLTDSGRVRARGRVKGRPGRERSVGRP